MADAVQPYDLVLNAGLDYVTPPILAKAGTLIDSLNYEVTSHQGYKRIDGVERRDGYPDGGISKWYSVSVSENIPGSISDVSPGDIVYSVVAPLGVETLTPVGVVVQIDNLTVRYAPFDATKRLIVGDSLLMYGTGYNYYVATTNTQDGREIITDPEAYLNSVRNYSATLRGLVGDAPSPVAGVFRGRDRSYEVLNTSYIRVYDVSGVAPLPGDVVRFRGQLWRYVANRDITDPTPGFKGEWHLIPLGVATTPVNNDMISDDGLGTVYATAQTADLLDTESYYGYLVWVWNEKLPGSIGNRGRSPITPAVTFNYTGGSTDNGSSPPLSAVSDTYFVTDATGVTLIAEVEMTSIIKTIGEFNDASAAGRVQVVVVGNPAGRSHFIVGDELHTEFPTTVDSKVLDIASSPEATLLAGTGALHTFNTRYQWGLYNFYGTPTQRQLYGCNGVTRAFWATPEAYGNIYTQDNAALDNPKYLTMHARSQLGLGFDAGSFQLSVVGEPYNYNGVDGALEIATGDDITGLLESQNDSTLIFGRRSIGRLTGSTDSDAALQGVSANSGAFNYTCVNVGTIPVFTGPNGVGTLEQTEAYGDFVGSRATDSIYNWLAPRLVPDTGSLELAGVACAFPVRGKNQYRLFLNTGDVVVCSFTQEGTKVMRSDYTTLDNTRCVPLAWSSSIADNGEEHIEIVWDRKLAEESAFPGDGLPNASRVYRMDSGWGFDGERFKHHFDVAWLFPTAGDTHITISRVRMYGVGYGVASLNVKSAGLEEDFNQPYHTLIQDISMPPKPTLLTNSLLPVTSIIDQANWGLAIKLRISYNDITNDNKQETEPVHICQVLKLSVEQGTGDL